MPHWSVGKGHLTSIQTGAIAPAVTALGATGARQPRTATEPEMKAVPAIAIATRWADFIGSPPPRRARPSRSMKLAAATAKSIMPRAGCKSRHSGPVLQRRSLAVGKSHSHLSV